MIDRIPEERIIEMNNGKRQSNIFCFVADTLVAMLDGSCKEIAKIKAGDSVLGFDRDSGRTITVEAGIVASSFHMRHVMLTFEDSTMLACTDDHPLWVSNKGWCVLEPGKALDNYGLATKCLSIGDKLLVLRNGLLRTVSLENIEQVLRPSRMWVIGTGSNHTFFANGVLAHDENVGSLELTRVHGVTVEKSNKRPCEEPALA